VYSNKSRGGEGAGLWGQDGLVELEKERRDKFGAMRSHYREFRMPSLESKKWMCALNFFNMFFLFVEFDISAYD
jgi:hypothetical protein